MLYNLTIGRLLSPAEATAQTSQQIPFTPNFLILGYESNSWLENCGILFFLSSIQVLLLLLFLAGSRVLCKCFRTKCVRCVKAMLCAPFIRTFL